MEQIETILEPYDVEFCLGMVLSSILQFWLTYRQSIMAFVVGDNCIQCKYTDCVAVCPTRCVPWRPEFHGNQPNRMHWLWFCVYLRMQETLKRSSKKWTARRSRSLLKWMPSLPKSGQYKWKSKHRWMKLRKWNGVSDKLAMLEKVIVEKNSNKKGVLI